MSGLTRPRVVLIVLLVTVLAASALVAPDAIGMIRDGEAAPVALLLNVIAIAAFVGGAGLRLARGLAATPAFAIAAIAFAWAAARWTLPQAPALVAAGGALAALGAAVLPRC